MCSIVCQWHTVKRGPRRSRGWKANPGGDLCRAAWAWAVASHCEPAHEKTGQKTGQNRTAPGVSGFCVKRFTKKPDKKPDTIKKRLSGFLSGFRPVGRGHCTLPLPTGCPVLENRTRPVLSGFRERTTDQAAPLSGGGGTARQAAHAMLLGWRRAVKSQHSSPKGLTRMPMAYYATNVA
jgi:hypothetical protein